MLLLLGARLMAYAFTGADVRAATRVTDYITFVDRCVSRQSLGGTPSQFRNARPKELGSSKPSRYAASFRSNAELLR
jgi:hypothetical protein